MAGLLFLDTPGFSRDDVVCMIVSLIGYAGLVLTIFSANSQKMPKW
jgi:hypothetical protein